MADNGQQHFAERMFPEPVDPGIARPDRATSSVEHGTDTGPKGEWRNEVWYQGSGAIGEKAVERIQIYPPTHGQQTQGDRVGAGADRHPRRHGARPAPRRLDRPHHPRDRGRDERGRVPARPDRAASRSTRAACRARTTCKARQGYLKLVEEGCVVVLGPMISDNSVNIRDLVNETGVACIGWTGSTRFDGEYCFTVANGDIPTESRRWARSGASRTATRRSASSGSSARRAPTTATGS